MEQKKTNICKGDIVNVYWENVECLYRVKVLYVPSSEGDFFVLEGGDGTIHNVQRFSCMSLWMPDHDRRRKVLRKAYEESRILGR